MSIGAVASARLRRWCVWGSARSKKLDCDTVRIFDRGHVRRWRRDFTVRNAFLVQVGEPSFDLGAVFAGDGKMIQAYTYFVESAVAWSAIMLLQPDHDAFVCHENSPPCGALHIPDPLEPERAGVLGGASLEIGNS